MCTAMDDLEQECEDVVFEVCDARERYPAMCANELARSIGLENAICMEAVKSRNAAKLETVIITDEQKILFDSVAIGTKHKNKECNEKLKNLLNKMEDLKIAAEQIEREKYCEMNKLLKK